MIHAIRSVSRPGTRLILALSGAIALGSCTPAPRPTGAILIVLDTLRADRVTAYGHTRPTTPNLDRLAARGVLFERAIAYASWTLPSMVAMLSGRYPTRRSYDRTLQTSLVETLANGGFHTAALAEGGFVSHFFGLDRGFDFFHESEGPVKLALEGRLVGGVGGGGAAATFGMATRWLQNHASEPFFLMVHTYEVHAPYDRRYYAKDLESGALAETFEVFDQKAVRNGELVLRDAEIEYLAALYDGGVRSVDLLVGALLEAIEELDIAGSTLIVVTSDHGEEFGQRFPRNAGDHGHSLYDELVRLPLIVYDPTRTYRESRIAAQVRNVDILPTILDLLGVPLPDGLDGRSLVPMMTGHERDDRIALAELARSQPAREAAGSGGFKLIRNAESEPGPENVELYDLRADPSERTNLAADEATFASKGADLTAVLDARRSQLDREGRTNFELHSGGEIQVEDRLRELGYVE